MNQTQTLFSLSMAIFLAGCSKQGGETTYQLPEAIVMTALAARSPSGGVIIEGKTNLPNGVALMLDLSSQEKDEYQAQDKVRVAKGRFRSASFMRDRQSLPYALMNLRIYAYFNKVWQSKEVLKIVGEGGGNLPKAHFIKLEDPSIHDSETVLDYFDSIRIPLYEPSSTQKAISLVQMATLSVDGRKSTKTVRDGFEFYGSFTHGEVHEGNGWRASSKGDDYFEVALDFINGRKDGADWKCEATWQANVQTGEVRYTNKYAKLFS